MKNRILIAYYSHSGNTKKVAKQMATLIGADLLEIETVSPYPSDYSGLSKKAKGQRDAGILPEIQENVCDIKAYDTVILGTPNWWNTLALPLRTFLTQEDLSGKNVISFCTHGGGGAGRIFSDINNLCGGCADLNGLSVYGSGGSRLKNDIEKWLEEVNLA